MRIVNADSVQAKLVEVDGAEGVEIRLLIHEAEGAPNFYMRQFTVSPGGFTPLHSHDWEHEVYILAGAGSVVTAGSEKSVAAGDCVYVAPSELHQFKNAGADELKFLCLVPRQSP